MVFQHQAPAISSGQGCPVHCTLADRIPNLYLQKPRVKLKCLQVRCALQGKSVLSLSHPTPKCKLLGFEWPCSYFHRRIPCWQGRKTESSRELRVGQEPEKGFLGSDLGTASFLAVLQSPHRPPREHLPMLWHILLSSRTWHSAWRQLCMQ